MITLKMGEAYFFEARPRVRDEAPRRPGEHTNVIENHTAKNSTVVNRGK